MAQPRLPAWLPFAVLLLVNCASAQPAFQRPVNQDCVAPSRTVSAQSVDSYQYFPDDYLVVGEAFTNNDHITVVAASTSAQLVEQTESSNATRPFPGCIILIALCSGAGVVCTGLCS